MISKIVRLPGAILTLACLMTAFASIAHAQDAEITGVIRDSQGFSVPDAAITVTNQSTAVTRQIVSNGSGNYSVPFLDSGLYTIQVKKTGFETVKRTGVLVSVATNRQVDITLTVGTVDQAVTVSTEPPALDTTDATLGQVMSPEMVEAMPLNQRDIVALTTLAPGVLPVRGMVQGGNLNNGGFIVRGMPRSSNIIYINGAIMSDGNGAPYILPNIDAIQEFQLKTGIYGPQYGIMDGGQLIVVTKSGGNRIHGDAFEYLRNDIFDATNYFSSTRTAFHRNDFGGTFGGPIYIPKLYDGRDKSWFFLSLEKVLANQYVPLFTTVPTAAQKQGQFSTQIIDPATGTPFPNNTIPSNRINSAAAQFLQFYPSPNTSSTINYYSDQLTTSDTPQIMVKVDYQENSKSRWWGQYIQNYTPQLSNSAIQQFSISDTFGAHVASFGNLYTFAGKYVNNISLNFYRATIVYPYPAGATCNFASSLGIPNFPSQSVDNCGVPTTSIQGFSGIGNPAQIGGPEAARGNWFIPEQISFQSGRHFVSGGVDFRQSFEFINALTPSSFSFTNLYSGNAFANFLLGIPTSTASGGGNRQNQAMKSMYYWVEDSIRASSKLTLDLGLRYEYRMPLKDKRGFSANFNTTTGQLFPPVQSATGNFTPNVPLATYSNKEGFLPRVGLAYQLPGNLVVRAGYALYAAEQVFGEAETLGQNPRPSFQRLTFTNPASAPVFTLANPFPVNLANQAIPSGGGMASPFTLERSHEWSLSLEKAFFKDWTFDLAYDASHTQNAIEQVYINDAPPGPGAIQPRRPYPNFASLAYTMSDGDAHYNGLETKLEKRPGNDHLSALVSFTWSKAIDDVEQRLSEAGENNRRSANMPLSRLKALSQANIGLRFVTSLDYALPFGAGRAFARHGLAAAIAGGWSTQTITTVQSGPWFTVFLAGDPLNTGDTSSEWPNRICNPNLPNSQRTRQSWFNTSCFVSPPAYTYGNAGRSSVQGPGVIDSDVALHRMFRLAHQQSLEFRVEAFNVFNHPNFGFPGSTYGVAGFGTITTALDPREVQLGFKYLF